MSEPTRDGVAASDRGSMGEFSGILPGPSAAKDRRYAVMSALRPAMNALRDAEDLCRLELHDAMLADRIRGVHESLTADVLNGKSTCLPDRWKARLWDRYCLLRGHDPDAGARGRFVFLRSLSKVPA